MDIVHAREAAVRAAGRASHLLRDRFSSPLEIEAKGRSDFVTEVDKLCEEIILQELMAFDDSIAFIGEESAAFELDETKLRIDIPSTCWIVDPLDGTSNFMHSFQGFCVSIALRVDDEIQLGVVQAPATYDRFTAMRGEGVFHESQLWNEPKLCKPVDNGDGMNLFATSVPFRHPAYIKEHLQLIERLHETFEDVRRAGSAALDLSWVANGSWATYLERFLKPWDVAAGGLFVEEAGGIISDFSGNAQGWLTSGEVVASANARVHEKVLSLIE